MSLVEEIVVPSSQHNATWHPCVDSKIVDAMHRLDHNDSKETLQGPHLWYLHILIRTKNQDLNRQVSFEKLSAEMDVLLQ